MVNNSYIQGIENANLFIKKGTDDVPSDGQYHLIKNGEIIFSGANLTKVQKRYIEVLKTIEYEKPIFNGPSVDDIKKSLQDNVYSSLPLDRKPFKKRVGRVQEDLNRFLQEYRLKEQIYHGGFAFLIVK